MPPASQALIQKIELLPPERMAEVVDFVEFLQMKEQAQSLTRAATAASESAFAAIWNNAEDEAYDAL